VSLSKKITEKRYLYIVESQEMDGESPDWSGSINALKLSLHNKMTKMETKMEAMMTSEAIKLDRLGE
jgi:Lhr-like helicase